MLGAHRRHLADAQPGAACRSAAPAGGGAAAEGRFQIRQKPPAPRHPQPRPLWPARHSLRPLAALVAVLIWWNCGTDHYRQEKAQIRTPEDVWARKARFLWP